MKRFPIVLLTILILFTIGLSAMTYSHEAFAQDRLKAPEFPAKAGWINASRPLTMKELRGRAVLLDFWTYCCINCMHVLPDLARLEDKYGDRLAVVGVHSAKFEGERDTGNIREAVRRYGIRHPVLNDAGFTMWNQLGVRAWPTLVLIDTEGYVVGRVSGEGNYDVLDRAIADVLAGGGSSGLLSPLPVTSGDTSPRETELYYPGKVIASPDGSRLYIADSGNNRIVIADSATGAILDSAGSGSEGLADGGFGRASFRNPQGMALDGNILYVADTGNHALRRLDLTTRQVETVTGDGVQARWGAKGGTAGSARLNSPWDVVLLDGVLYIAMAGPHQIWTFDPATNRVAVFAGSGREDIVDGPLADAALAQTSGITTDGHDLYFADSETSSLRKIDMTSKRVVTLAGTGLFDFGHRDGPMKRGLFQHPLCVVWNDGVLWVADTYNNRIRKADLGASVLSTVAGASEDGLTDGRGLSSRFDEPGGLAYYGGRLYIADTNNHTIRVLDTTSGDVTTLPVHREIAVPRSTGAVTVTLLPPEGFHVTNASPASVAASWGGGGSAESVDMTVADEAVTAVFSLPDTVYGETVRFGGDIYLCDEGDGASCYIRSFAVSARVGATETSVPAAVTYTVQPPVK